MYGLNRDERTRVSFTLNGQSVSGMAEPRMLLTDFLRTVIGATGTHVGCEHGVCGACTVLMDDEPVRACLVFAVQARGRRIRTVESLAGGDDLHPLQRAFVERHAIQCGFCTPGMLMLALNLYETGGAVSREEIVETLSANLCRCTGYANLVEAVADALAARDAT